MWREEEREEKHEIQGLKCEDFVYDGTCNAQDHFKPTARTQKIGDVAKVCVFFLISTHFLNTAKREILPFQRSKNV